MGQLTDVMNYVHTHPLAAGITLAALVASYVYLLRHKSKLSRELDLRLDELRRERGDFYNSLRPPQ